MASRRRRPTLTERAISLFHAKEANTVSFFRHLMVIEAHPDEYDDFTNFRAYLRHNDFCTISRYDNFQRAVRYFGRYIDEPLEFFGLDGCLEVIRQPSRRRRMAVRVLRDWIQNISPGHHQPTQQKARSLLNLAFGRTTRTRVHFTAEAYAAVEAAHAETGRRWRSALEQNNILLRYIEALHTHLSDRDQYETSIVSQLRAAGIRPATARPRRPRRPSFL